MARQEKMSAWKRFVTYFKAPENAVPLKIAIFAFSGGAICVFPFLVLQMKAIGFTIKEIALIYLVIPIASLLGPIISGMIGDKLGKYNLVVAANMTLTMIFFDLLLTVPQVPLPTGTIYCGEDLNCVFNIPKCDTCMTNETTDVTFKLQNCHFVGNEIKTELQMEQEKYNLYNQIDVLTNNTGNCSFSISDEQHGILNSYFQTTPSRDIVCGIAWNSECKEDMKTLYTYSFWLFLTIKFCGNLFAAAAFTMSDASILALSRKYNLSVGKQKIMTMLAFAITPLISGLLIDYHSSIVGYKSYVAAFSLATAMTLVSIVIMIFLKIEAEKGSGKMLRDIKKLLTHKEVVLFLIVLLILGTNFGFIESYIFIYLTSLGASGFLLGFTMTVGCTFSIPMLFYADKLEDKIGRRNIYLLCFTCYGIRMTGYSYIWNPWMGLLFETFEAFTYQLMWVTSLKVFPILAPKGLLATMTGIAGAIHYSFGKGIGGFVGGQVIEMIGMRLAFRVMALLSIGGAAFYFVIDKLVLEEKFAKRGEEMKNETIEAAVMETDGFHKNSEEKNVQQFLLPDLLENGKNLSEQQRKKGFQPDVEKCLARSMPHLLVLENQDISYRHSVIGAWISSEKLFL